MTSSSAATRGMTFLPRGGRGRDDRVIAGRQRHDQRRQRLGQLVRIGGAVGEQHLLDAGELGGGLGGGRGALRRRPAHAPSRAELRRPRSAPCAVASFERRVVVFGDEAASSSSDHPGFVLELGDQFGDRPRP